MKTQRTNSALFVIACAMVLFISTVFLALGIPYLVAGVALLKHWGWARILAMLLAIVALSNFPLGTAAGVYTLWVLTNKETEQLLSTAILEHR